MAALFLFGVCSWSEKFLWEWKESLENILTQATNMVLCTYRNYRTEFFRKVSIMERKEAFEIVASWIKTCHDLAENDRYEAMDEPSERDMYMRSAKAWEEREEAFGIILGLARGYEYHEGE